MEFKADLKTERGRTINVQPNRIKLWAKPDARKVSELMHFDVLKGATSGVDRNGQAFAPLSPETTRQKSGDTPLVGTGDMLASMRKYATDKRSKVSVVRRFYYAAMVNFGTRRMPAREFMGFTPGLEQEVFGLYANTIDKRANAWGDPTLSKDTDAPALANAARALGGKGKPPSAMRSGAGGRAL